MIPIYDTVIVGGGPAGLSAAITAASEGMLTAVLANEPGQAERSPNIENLPGHARPLSGSDLIDRMTRQAVNFGVALHHKRAYSIVPAGRAISVQAHDGERFFGRTAILATGCTIDPPGVQGVEYCAVGKCGRYVQGESVAIIGASNAAAQAALHATQSGMHVTLVARSGLTARMSAFLVDQVVNNVHNILEGASVVRIKQGLFGGHTYRLSDEMFDRYADHLEAWTGGTPNTKWCANVVDRTDYGQIENTVPGIFVAGDARAGSTPRIVCAMADGTRAAMDAYDYLLSSKPFK